LVAEFEETQAQLLCEKCGLDVDLNTINQIPLVKIVSDFRIEYAGLPFNKYEWIRFYEKMQKFMTLCPDCETIEQMKNNNERRRKTSIKISSKLTTSRDNKNNGSVGGGSNKVLKSILFPWHLQAKSRLLHKTKAV